MHTSPNQLKKVLGLAFGIAVVVGGTIGVGILRGPSSIAAILPNVPLILLCWLAIGLYTMLSASSYAEMTTMLPQAGGAYNYIKRAFGNYAGFLNGWLDFISNAIAPAYFCIVLGEYSALLIPGLAPYGRYVAVLFLTIFTLLNLPGVKSGSATQKITSAIKVLLFLVLVIGCLISGPNVSSEIHEVRLIEGSLLVAIFKALQLIKGAYDGWGSVSFFAEEDGNPSYNIPKAYFIGALTVTIIYVLINGAVFYVLPVQQVAGTTLAVSEAASVAFGHWSNDLIIIIALFSLFSILNAYMMIPSRILFGLSRDGFFVRQGSAVNKGGTPYISLLLCYALAIILIFFSSFEQLFALGAFLLTIVTGFAFLSLIWLRKKEPDLYRPYKAWGYPYSTYFTLLITFALLLGFAISDKESLLITTGIVVLSYPCYKFFVSKNSQAA